MVYFFIDCIGAVPILIPLETLQTKNKRWTHNIS